MKSQIMKSQIMKVRTHSHIQQNTLILPTVAWFVFFMLIPLGYVIFYSFLKKGLYGGVVFEFSTANYLRAFDPLYLKIFWNSILLALTTAVSCLFLGYPLALMMATAPKRIRPILLILVIIPFWTNFVVRAYAVKVLLADQGPINQALQWLGIINDPIGFLNSPFAVWLGMVSNYLPFMVLPLYVSLEKFDFSLLEAARDLGASSIQVVLRVLLPLTKAGMITGFILVFAPALGEFVVPDLFGGARTMLIGNLITDQFLKSRDWPFGSAISLILILAVMLTLIVYLKNQKISDQKKAGS